MNSHDGDALLALQAIDTRLDQLTHRRVHLPQRAELKAREQELAKLAAATAEVVGQRSVLSRDEKRLEDEIALVRDKSAKADKALYSGATNSPKELQALQDEIAMFARRQRELEDQELELMETAEPLDAELARAEAKRTELDAACVALLGAIAEAETAIDAAVAEAEMERAEAVTAVPEPLLEEYNALRVRMGGVAAARLVGNRCDGCHLTLSAMEVDELRRAGADTLVHCSECGRLLVR